MLEGCVMAAWLRPGQSVVVEFTWDGCEKTVRTVRDVEEIDEGKFLISWEGGGDCHALGDELWKLSRVVPANRTWHPSFVQEG